MRESRSADALIFCLYGLEFGLNSREIFLIAAQHVFFEWCQRFKFCGAGIQFQSFANESFASGLQPGDLLFRSLRKF